MTVARQTVRVLSMIVLTSLFGGFTVLLGQTQDENWKNCKSEDPDQSLRACSALIQSKHVTGISLAKAFYDRGLAYAHKGDYDRAIQDYDQALGLDPAFAYPFYGRGWVYARKGNYDHAIQDYDQALRLNPDLAVALRGRGTAFTYKDDYDHALQDYDQALLLNPSDSIALGDRGLAYAHKGDYDQAIRD
jgi:tetratricopeptide (TPR) repeat protein